MSRILATLSPSELFDLYNSLKARISTMDANHPDRESVVGAFIAVHNAIMN
jgi:hypothetical protein